MPSITVTTIPFTPVEPKLFIGTTGAGVSIECAATDIDISPEQDESTIETFCTTAVAYKSEKWTITASCYQSYGTTGLWTALHPLCGTVVPFVFIPDRDIAVSVDNPMMSGTAYLKGIPFYANGVGTPNVFDVVLSVRGIPTFVTTGTMPTMAEAQTVESAEQAA